MNRKVFRDGKDGAAFSGGCLVTVFLTVALLLVGIFGLSVFCMSHPGALLRNVYQYMTPFIEGTAEDRAAFSNAYMEIAARLEGDPMFLTNEVLVTLSRSARKRRITSEDTKAMERALSRSNAREALPGGPNGR